VKQKNIIMKVFRIQYISRFYEEKNHYSKIAKANSEEEAIKKFAKHFGIRNYKKLREPNYVWDDGQWMSSFKCINEVEIKICPCCNRKQIVEINNYGFK